MRVPSGEGPGRTEVLSACMAAARHLVPNEGDQMHRILSRKTWLAVCSDPGLIGLVDGRGIDLLVIIELPLTG